MASLKIDSVDVTVEQGIEYLDDGTEEFDLGTFLIKNTTQRTPYPDYADVEIVIGASTIEACVRKDSVKRTSNGTNPRYEHTITIAEPNIKLAAYPHPDKLFNTKSGLKTNYKIHLQELIQAAFYGKTEPLTIATATQTFLEVEADEKEYSGGDLFKSTVDLFRQVEAVPTLNLDNEIGHKDIRQLGSLISFDRVDGEIIESDIGDYALKVYSKVKNATYEADLITGGTYYPAKGYGVTARVPSTEAKYTDDKAIYSLDSGIRRMIQTRSLNMTIAGTTQTFLQLNIVSKEEWDNLLIQSDRALVYLDDYKNNTPYFIEGDSTIYNIGTDYEYKALTVPVISDKVLPNAIARALYLLIGIPNPAITPTNIKDYELEFYYGVQRDMDVVQERHDITRVTKVTAISNQQKDSKLELARFGNANKNLINRIGNDKYQITVRYFDRDTPTLFEVGDYTSDGYRVIKRQFLLRNDSADVTYLLTKNQSILNPTTSVKRNFTSPFTISKRNIQTNYVYEGYIEFSTTDRFNQLTNNNFKEILLNALDYDSAYDTPLYNCQYRRSGTSDYINMSVASVPMGSSFEFHAQFNHPKFAGYQLVSDGLLGDKIVPVSYGDANGEVGSAQFLFGHTSVVNSDLHPLGTFTSDWRIQIPTTDTDLNPDEQLAITYAAHCYSDNPNFFIGSYFLQNNSLVKELGVSQTLVLAYYFANPKYTVYDKYKNDVLPNGLGTITVDPSYEFFDILVPNGTSWALYESGGQNRLYFAYNNTGTDMTRIYPNLLIARTDAKTL